MEQRIVIQNRNKTKDY